MSDFGLSLPVPDARERVDGTLEYASDVTRPGTLHARLARAQVAHGRLGQIQAPDGVRVYAFDDLARYCANPYWGGGPKFNDQPILAHRVVRFYGEPMAAVVDEDEEAAEDAVSQVFAGYEELPAVFDERQALEPGAPLVHEERGSNLMTHHKLRSGDVEEGFQRADLVLEETFTSPVAQHVPLETHVCLAEWEGDRLTVWSGTQHAWRIKAALQEMFGLPQDQVRILAPPLGGGYGSKQLPRLETVAAALARAAGRPVRLTVSREEEFYLVTKHQATLRLKSGVTRDGRILARQAEIWWSVGAYSDQSPMLTRSGMYRVTGPYRIERVRVDSYGVYTNLPPAAAFRGAMSSQGAWACESHTDSLAAALELDPTEFRRRNLIGQGEAWHTGERMHDVHFAQLLQASLEGLEPGQPPPAGVVHLKRGRGAAVMMKSTVTPTRSDSRVRLAAGRLTVFASTTDMGQGSRIALAQIASLDSGLPAADIEVVLPDTQVTPFDMTTSASRSTASMGSAIRLAVQDLRSRLQATAAPMLEAESEEVVWSGHVLHPDWNRERTIELAKVLEALGGSLEAEASFRAEGGTDPDTGRGIASYHWHQGAAAVEVEVDVQTGKVRLLQVSGASWAGRMVNPVQVRLQNEGCVIWGMGPAMMEEVHFQDGQVANPNLSDYMIPAFPDMPPRVVTQGLEGPEGSEIHGVGEMILPCIAPAIANAIYRAAGVRIRALPFTPERVLKALEERP